MEFFLKSGYIELDNLLKALGLAQSGAGARQSVQSGLVRVNGQPETRVRRKLRADDTVEYAGSVISIVGEKNGG